MKIKQILFSDLLFIIVEAGIFWNCLLNGYIILKIFPFLYNSISFFEIYTIMSIPLALYLIYSYYQTKEGFYVFITLIRELQLIIIVFASILAPFVFSSFISFDFKNFYWPSLFLLVLFLLIIAIALMFYKKLLSYTTGKDISSWLFFLILLYTLIMLSGVFFLFPGLSAI